VNTFKLGDQRYLIKGIHDQHSEQRRLELITVSLGLRQLHEGFGEAQGAANLLFDLGKDRGFTVMHIQQREDR